MKASEFLEKIKTLDDFIPKNEEQEFINAVDSLIVLVTRHKYYKDTIDGLRNELIEDLCQDIATASDDFMSTSPNKSKEFHEKLLRGKMNGIILKQLKRFEENSWSFE